MGVGDWSHGLDRMRKEDTDVPSTSDHDISERKFGGLKGYTEDGWKRKLGNWKLGGDEIIILDQL